MNDFLQIMLENCNQKIGIIYKYTFFITKNTVKNTYNIVIYKKKKHCPLFFKFEIEFFIKMINELIFIFFVNSQDS